MKDKALMHRYDLSLVNRWRELHSGHGELQAFAKRHGIGMQTVYNYFHWVTSGERAGVRSPLLSAKVREALWGEV